VAKSKSSRLIYGEKRNATDLEGGSLDIYVLNIGEGIELYRVRDFALMMGFHKKRAQGHQEIEPNIVGARATLLALGVRTIEWPNGESYFNFQALEKAFLLVSRFGGPGFIAPGTAAKGNRAYRSSKRKTQLGVTDVTAETIKEFGAGLDEELTLAKALRRGASRQALLKLARRAGAAILKEPKEPKEEKP